MREMKLAASGASNGVGAADRLVQPILRTLGQSSAV
jgi:hypothetical protein